MLDQFARTALLFGADAMNKLRSSRVAVFGVGGVGGYAVEALGRSGIGTLDLIDSDKVSLTNLNRQIIALHSTVGQYKVDVAASRLHDINPDITVHAHRCFYLPETADQFDFSQYDYVIDAIDTVKGKIEIIMRAKEAGVRPAQYPRLERICPLGSRSADCKCRYSGSGCALSCIPARRRQLTNA